MAAKTGRVDIMQRSHLYIAVCEQRPGIAHDFFNFFDRQIICGIKSNLMEREICHAQADLAFNLGAVNLPSISGRRWGRSFRKYSQCVKGWVFAISWMVNTQ